MSLFLYKLPWPQAPGFRNGFWYEGISTPGMMSMVARSPYISLSSSLYPFLRPLNIASSYFYTNLLLQLHLHRVVPFTLSDNAVWGPKSRPDCLVGAEFTGHSQKAQIDESDLEVIDLSILQLVWTEVLTYGTSCRSNYSPGALAIPVTRISSSLTRETRNFLSFGTGRLTGMNIVLSGKSSHPSLW
jgi:hypothetical protein